MILLFVEREAGWATGPVVTFYRIEKYILDILLVVYCLHFSHVSTF